MSLASMTNGKIYFSLDITDKFGKSRDWFCIGCKGKMIFHRDLAKVKIAHFVHKVPCSFETEPETQEHLMLKNWCYYNLNAEKKYKPDSFFIGDQKPDVFIEDKVKKIAVEVQCSKISYGEWWNRTKKYSEKGIYVLWIFGNNYCPKLKKLCNQNNKYAEKRISIIEKEMHRLNYGKVYYFQFTNQVSIEAIHFEGVYRESEHSMYEGVWLKNTKSLKFKSLPSLNIRTFTNEGLNIAGFYDGVWWK